VKKKIVELTISAFWYVFYISFFLWVFYGFAYTELLFSPSIEGLRPIIITMIWPLIVGVMSLVAFLKLNRKQAKEKKGSF